MRRGTTGQAIWIISLLVVLGLVVQLFLPQAAAWFLAGLLRREVGAEGRLSVEIESLPAVELLLGQIDRLQVDARAVRLDNLVVETLLVDVRDLQVDLGELLRGRFAAREQGAARARLVLTEEALNEYLWAQWDPSRRFRIRLTPAAATLE
ncbi:MAG TPA: LmeA family phospholipid-binding protein, partial [Limnochorda sp.]